MKKRFDVIVCIPVGKGTGILDLFVRILRIGTLLMLKKKVVEVSEPEEIDGDLTTVDHRITVSW